MFMNAFTQDRIRDPRKENLTKLRVNLQLNYWKQTYTFRHFLFVTTLVHRIDSLESCLALAIFRVQATEKTLSNRAFVFTVNLHSALVSKEISRKILQRDLEPRRVSFSLAITEIKNWRLRWKFIEFLRTRNMNSISCSLCTEKCPLGSSSPLQFFSTTLNFFKSTIFWCTQFPTLDSN